VEEQAPLRQQRILETDPDGAAAAASDAAYVGWKTMRDEVIDRASQPLLSVQTVTTLARSEAATGGIQVEIVKCPSSPERPGGRRFGVLVHAILADVDLQSPPEAVRLAAGIHGRLVDATEDEIRAAAVTVETALLHPIMRRAARAADNHELRREAPILLQRADGTLAEGTVDLAFREDTPDFNGWTVVDFKTGAEFEANRARYTTQLTLYAEAVGQATSLPTKTILFVV
jgi:ATP-dependent exoDNAse (exonuclease V) beta subunit